MEIRLARANSLIDIEDGGDAGVVTGVPAMITEWVSCVVPQPAQSISPSYTPDKAPCCFIKEQKGSGAPIYFHNGHVSESALDFAYA
jgi:hypothetical protein